MNNILKFRYWCSLDEKYFYDYIEDWAGWIDGEGYIEQFINKYDINQKDVYVGDYVGTSLNNYGLIKDLSNWEWIKIDLGGGEVKEGSDAMDQFRCLNCMTGWNKSRILGNVHEGLLKE